MLKVSQKRKKANNVKAAHAEAQATKIVAKPRPGWNDTVSDTDRYKLTQTELIQKKVSLMSKNRTEARELWLRRQDKLQKGVLDEETQSVIETCSKRPPEKNFKNNTYFIREGADSRSLRMNMRENDTFEASTLTIESCDKKEESELITKIDRDLKETRDFIKKFDKISHQKNPSANPEKLLIAHESMKTKNYDTNAEEVVRRSSSRPVDKAMAKKAAATLSKSSSKRSISKDNSAKLPDQMKSSVLSKNYEQGNDSENSDSEAQDPKENSFEKLRRLAQKDDEIACCFSSLNRIEDTIKFLEQNIMGATNDMDRENNLRSSPEKPTTLGRQCVKDTNKENNARTFGPIDINDFFTGSPVPQDPEDRFELKHSSEFVHGDNKNISFDIENFEPRITTKDRNTARQASDDAEEDPISFSLTMRSNRSLDFYQEIENKVNASMQAAKEPIPRKSALPQSQGPFEQNYFSNEDQVHQPRFEHPFSLKEIDVRGNSDSRAFGGFQRETVTKKIVENENKENEFTYDENEEIERIKQLLKTTQEDIQKMNSVAFEFPGQSLKKEVPTTIRSQPGIWDVPSKNNNFSYGFPSSTQQLSHNPSYGSFGSNTPLGMTSFKEPVVSAKPQMNNLMRGFDKAPLQDITNQLDDEVPRPMLLKSRPVPAAHPGNDRNSLSIRANLR